MATNCLKINDLSRLLLAESGLLKVCLGFVPKSMRVLKGCSFFEGSTHPSDLLLMLDLLPVVLTSEKMTLKLGFDLKLANLFYLVLCCVQLFYLFALRSSAGSKTDGCDRSRTSSDFLLFFNQTLVFVYFLSTPQVLSSMSSFSLNLDILSVHFPRMRLLKKACQHDVGWSFFYLTRPIVPL